MRSEVKAKAKTPPHVFKAYDIRGVVPRDIDTDFAYRLGQAFASAAWAQGERAVAVGRDGRLSSPALAQALARGLSLLGIRVLDIGMATTPMLYFAATTRCNSGIAITGSHNPRDYNGFKMVLAGAAIYGQAIQDLRCAMEQSQWVLRSGGAVECVDIGQEYTQEIVQRIQLARPLHIVVDCGNGVAGASAPAVLKALGCRVTELFSAVDGNFPNHHPDPGQPGNLQDLIQAVHNSDAELGLAFDGDGDRLGVVTRTGEVIYPDRQMLLFVQDVLQRYPGASVVFDVKCSQRLAPAIEAAGGVAVMYKTGHSLIKAKMRALNAPLGGEMSGHIFFKDRWYGFDDGTYAAARLLELLSRHADASAALAALPSSFSTPELTVACAEGEAHCVVQNLQAKVQAMQCTNTQNNAAQTSAIKDATIHTIDGLRIDWPDGFGLIRASNTTPVLILRFEGHSNQALQRIQKTMLDFLYSCKPDFKLQNSEH